MEHWQISNKSDKLLKKEDKHWQYEERWGSFPQTE